MATTSPPDTASFSGVFRELPAGPRLDLTSPGRRLNRAACGWSRLPRHRSNLQGPWLRQKRWNAWGCTTADHYLLVGLMQLDYAAIASTYLYEFASGKFQHMAVQRLLGRGLSLDEWVEGPCQFAGGGLTVDARPVAEGTRLVVSGRGNRGPAVEIDLILATPPDHESLNLVIPWSDTRYHFTSKQACLPVTGQVSFGDTTLTWGERSALGWLDFARGVWPYRSGWRWAMCATWVGDRRVGFNLGAGWTDGTGVNENALYVDGRLIKLADDVTFEFDRGDRLRPWRIVSQASGQVDLEFQPAKQHVDGMNLGIIAAQLAQVLGHYRGRLRTDDGETIELDGAVGVAEDQQARW